MLNNHCYIIIYNTITVFTYCNWGFSLKLKGKRQASVGALNLQGIEFARKGGGNCKEENIQGKAPQFASV